MSTAVTTVRGTFSMRHGTEGPHHDPYGFVETMFHSPDLSVILHQGLAQWIQVNGGEQTDFVQGDYDNDAVQSAAFKTLTGLSPHEIEKYSDKLASKCRKCGNDDFKEQSGFAGESFTVCALCGHIVRYDFDESAIV